RAPDPQAERQVSGPQAERRAPDPQAERQVSGPQAERRAPDPQEERQVSGPQAERRAPDPQAERRAPRHQARQWAPMSTGYDRRHWGQTLDGLAGQRASRVTRHQVIWLDSGHRRHLASSGLPESTGMTLRALFWSDIGSSDPDSGHRVTRHQVI
ncbi:unnamed protein product, partial [Staurois parvus]